MCRCVLIFTARNVNSLEVTKKEKKHKKKTMIKNHKHQQGHSNYCTVIVLPVDLCNRYEEQ